MSGVLASIPAIYQPVKPGQQQWTAVGAFSFVVPAGVTSIAAVVIGGGGGGANTSNGYSYLGGGGGGGALVYHNAIPVTPGETLTISVGNGGFGATGSLSNGSPGGFSYIKRGSTTLLHAGGGAPGTQSSGIGYGGAGGTPGTGLAGAVGYPGGNGSAGREPSQYSNGGFSGRYTSNGSDGWEGDSTQFAAMSADLKGGSTGTYGTGSGGCASIASRDPGNSGAIRIMWGKGRAFPLSLIHI